MSVLFLVGQAWAQSPRILEGQVWGENGKGEKIALRQATLRVLPGKQGSLTDSTGKFRLEVSAQAEFLVAAYSGFRNDTLPIKEKDFYEFILGNDFEADSVHIEAEKSSSVVDPFKTQLTEVVDRKGLLKAACCNLGESFETNASVDVQFNDALTGTRQIQLLGLAGPYTQLTLESMPGIRGLASSIGLDLIPGPWIESIQISKGTGSVINGYESFVGQINVELEKPQDGRKLYINGYGNRGGRSELNLNTTHKFSDKLGTTLLLHGSLRPLQLDRNEDGFQDMPLTRHWNVINRWHFSNEKNLEAQAGVQMLQDRRQSSDIESFPGAVDYQAVNAQARIWAKVGWVNPDRPGESLGLQLMGQEHRQEQRAINLGFDRFSGRQQSLYTNLIYQNFLGNTNHNYRLGANFSLDRQENTFDSILGPYDFTERVPGIFMEYTYKYLDKFRLIAGLRGDFHNLWGFFLTPRLHLLFRPDDESSIRFSAGRGQRTSSIFAENFGRFLNQRDILIRSESNLPAYGLPPEVAWNVGFNLSRNFRLRYRPFQLRAEYFLTIFEQLTVVDLENPRQVSFYALDGEALAHSAMVEAKLEIHRRFGVKAAYKWQRTLIDYDEGRLDRPFLPRHRAFLNGTYKTRSQWAFDATLQWVGPQRIPSTSANPTEFRLEEQSLDFFLLSAQVSRPLGDRWEVYLGGENLLDFRQDAPILAAEGNREFFDASLIWGPVFGRMIYGGFRFTL